jgi:hypothetical protein
MTEIPEFRPFRSGPVKIQNRNPNPWAAVEGPPGFPVRGGEGEGRGGGGDEAGDGVVVPAVVEEAEHGGDPWNSRKRRRKATLEMARPQALLVREARRSHAGPSGWRRRKISSTSTAGSTGGESRRRGGAPAMVLAGRGMVGLGQPQLARVRWFEPDRYALPFSTFFSPRICSDLRVIEIPLARAQAL